MAAARAWTTRAYFVVRTFWNLSLRAYRAIRQAPERGVRAPGLPVYGPPLQKLQQQRPALPRLHGLALHSLLSGISDFITDGTGVAYIVATVSGRGEKSRARRTSPSAHVLAFGSHPHSRNPKSWSSRRAL